MISGWSLRFLALVPFLIILLMTGCTSQSVSPLAQPDETARIKVVTSFYPLTFFAGAIGGDRVEVICLVPDGVVPHDWEPKASDVRTLNQAEIFIYNGAGLEPWTDKLLRSHDNETLVVVDTSTGLELLAADPDHGHNHGHNHGHEHPHEPSAFDPHIWLDPVLAQHQAQKIAEALAGVDPDGEETFAANAGALLEKLQALDREYQTLASCPRSLIVVSHSYFGYPAQRYGLTQISIMGLAPDAEPTPRQLAQLVTLVREQDIRYIFTETLIGDRVAQVIAKETGAQILVLNPIEGLTAADRAAGKDYFTLMRENLDHLKIALGCDR